MSLTLFLVNALAFGLYPTLKRLLQILLMYYEAMIPIVFFFPLFGGMFSFSPLTHKGSIS